MVRATKIGRTNNTQTNYSHRNQNYFDDSNSYYKKENFKNKNIINNHQALFSEAIKSSNNFSSTSRYDNTNEEKKEKGNLSKTNFTQRNYKSDGLSSSIETNNFHKYKNRDFNNVKPKYSNGKNFSNKVFPGNINKNNEVPQMENTHIKTQTDPTFVNINTTNYHQNSQPQTKSKYEKEKSKDFKISQDNNYLNKVFPKNNTNYQNKSNTNFAHQNQGNLMSNLSGNFYSPNAYVGINNRSMINSMGLNNVNNINNIGNMNYMTYSIFPINNYYSPNEGFGFPGINNVTNNFYSNTSTSINAKQSQDKKIQFSVVVKLKSEEKTIFIYKGENYEKKAYQFCVKNRLSQKLIKPLNDIIISASTCLDNLMRKELTPFEFNQLDSIKDTYMDYKENLMNSETQLNLSSFTMPDEPESWEFINRSF